MKAIPPPFTTPPLSVSLQRAGVAVNTNPPAQPPDEPCHDG
jgi:hypothetical protein